MHPHAHVTDLHGFVQSLREQRSCECDVNCTMIHVLCATENVILAIKPHMYKDTGKTLIRPKHPIPPRTAEVLITTAPCNKA
jgi:hypothetical protein